MAKENPRIKRINDMLSRELALLLQREAKDPRFKQVSVLGVKVSRDLSYAKIYVNVLDSDEETNQAITKALNKAAGYFRSAISQRITLRTTPKLQFIYDRTTEEGNRLTALINEAIANDTNVSETLADDANEVINDESLAKKED